MDVFDAFVPVRFNACIQPIAMPSTAVHFSGQFLSDRMNDFKTPDHLRGPVADVVAELRRLGYPDLFEATSALLTNVQNGVLETPDALLRLSHLLRTARLDEIGRFFHERDMTLDGFEAAVRSRAFRENLAQLVDAMTLRKAAGIVYSTDERRALLRLRDALKDVDAADGSPSTISAGASRDRASRR